MEPVEYYYEIEEPWPRRGRHRIGKGWIFATIGVVAGTVVTAIVVVLAVLGVFSGHSRTDASGWQEVISPEGRFRVLMPGEPRKEVRTVQGEVGPVTDTNFAFDTNEWYLRVRYTDFDAPGQLASPLEGIIKSRRDSIVKKYQAFVLRENEITISGYSGKEIAMEIPRRGTTYIRWLPVNRRLYTVAFMNNLATSRTTEVRHFFDSFQLTE